MNRVYDEKEEKKTILVIIGATITLQLIGFTFVLGVLS